MSLTSLKKMKEPPLRGEQYSIKDRAGEIRGLEKQKEALLKEIKKLGQVFFRLDEGRRNAEEEVANITTERLSTMTHIAREISSELERDAEKIRKKSSKLDKHEDFLDELNNYLYAYAQIVEAETQLNVTREVHLNKEVARVLSKEKRTSKMLINAQESSENARLDGEVAKHKRIEIVELTKWFQNQADQERHRLDTWSRTVGMREKKVESKKRSLEKVAKKQEEKGLWLIDREGILSRTMSEIRKRESGIMNNGK